VVVRPGSERTARLDLSRAYAVGPPGRYRVSFSGVLPDVRREGVADPADFRPVTLACAAAEFSVAGVAGR
jgi:hypothetical protein